MTLTNNKDLRGVIPAVVTPLSVDGSLHLENLALHVQTLKAEGCHGVLFMGTTGEGPSFDLSERMAVFEAGIQTAGDMLVLAGTGCASLSDTITLTRGAFELGAQGVVVIPPFYFKNVSTDGLLEFYRRVLEEAVPDGGKLLLYHFPNMSQVPITFELLEQLLTLDSSRVAGIKDSSGDADHLFELCTRFPTLKIFAGSDRLLHEGLKRGVAGCITAAANILAPLNAAVFDAFEAGDDPVELQAALTAGRSVIERFTPFPSSVKYLLTRRYHTPGWEVRPPLVSFPEESGQRMIEELRQSGISDRLEWMDQL